MTTGEKELWVKMSSFKIDDASSSFKFSQRLARENGWTISYSERVIEEYKKFIFLCCITKTGVTPSDQVDQAWHLHLTFTKSYWTDLCKNILAREIHHNPTRGGQAEGKKFDDFYSETIRLYKEKFRLDPPEDIWPDNETRFSDINFKRVNFKKYWLIRRPSLNKGSLSIFLLAGVSFFFIQASAYNPIGIIAVLILGVAIYSFFRKGGGGSGGSGSSTGGCGGSGHSGCSGCSASGCSGCGGGCGS